MSTAIRRAVLAALFLPLAASSLRSDESAAVARIDQLVLEGLKKEGVEPNADTSDETFVRRVHLDLIGRIPTKAETLAFLESEEAGKRADLVDALVGSDGYVSHTYNWFADLLRMRTAISGNGQSAGAGLAYERWIKTAIRENRPYDELVRDLVTASGNSWENPAIGYYLRDYNMPLDNLAITTQVFLGTQIVCAQCHNHPFDSWTQMDYYRLAAFTYGMSGANGHPVQQAAFDLLKEQRKQATQAKGKGNGGRKEAANRYAGELGALRKAASEIFFPVRYNNVRATDRLLRLPHDYQYDDANPLSVVKPMTLFGGEAVLEGGSHPIDAFGEWLVSPENPRFTKVIANRLWKRAFGVGLVEPVDDFRENVAASNPALFDYLEQLMVSLGYDLQAFQRILFKTEAYQREAALAEPVPGVPYPFAGPILRRMSAEQIWDSLVSMTVADSDRPDEARDLYADRKLAEVQLVAESIYDQTPAQFLKNLREVVKIQSELSVRIEAAQAKVAEARERGDADLIKQAVAEARTIRRELSTLVEEVVYRDGLKRKFAQLAGRAQAEPAALGVPAGDGADDPSAPAGDLMDQLAATVFAGERGFDEDLDEILGGESRGLVAPLVDAIFAPRQEALRHEHAARQAREREAWKVVSKEARVAYRQFDRVIRGRMRRASELVQPAPADHFLREFGQSDRELVENSNDEASITQALAMLNGPVLSAVTNRYSVLMRDMRGERFEDRLDTIYLTMLSRRPTEEEKGIFREAWAVDPESGTVPGIVWTLLNTRQFLFIQ